MRVNPSGELDPAVDVRRRYKKNSLSVLSCIDKRKTKAVIMAAKSGQFTTGEAG